MQLRGSIGPRAAIILGDNIANQRRWFAKPQADGPIMQGSEPDRLFLRDALQVDPHPRFFGFSPALL